MASISMQGDIRMISRYLLFFGIIILLVIDTSFSFFKDIYWFAILISILFLSIFTFFRHKEYFNLFEKKKATRYFLMDAVSLILLVVYLLILFGISDSHNISEIHFFIVAILCVPCFFGNDRLNKANKKMLY